MGTLFLDKKATSHLEMIMSFAIFIIFIIFLFAYLPPVQKPGLSDVLLDSLQFNIQNLSTINLLEIPAIIPNGTTCSPPCIDFENPLQGSGSSEHKYILVRNENSIVSFRINSENISIQKLGSIYYIYYSNETNFSGINKDPLSQDTLCGSCTYSFSAPRIYAVYSLEILNKTAEETKSNYAAKKQEFGILASSDFIFKLRDSGDKVILSSSAKEPPFKISVKARDIPIEYLDESGAMQKGTLNIKVW